MVMQLIDPSELGVNYLSFPYQSGFGYAAPTNGVSAGGLVTGSDFKYQGGAVAGRYYFWRFAANFPMYTGFHIQVTDNTTNRVLFKWWDSTDAAVNCSLHLTSSGTLRAVTGASGGTLTTGTTVLQPGTVYWVDVYTDFAASGTFHVWIDEVSEFNVTGDTKGSGNGRDGSLEYPDDDTVYVDNVMAVNTDTSTTNLNISRIGPTTVMPFIPKTIDTVQNLTLVGSSPGPEALSERPFDTTSYYEATPPIFVAGITFPTATDTYATFNMGPVSGPDPSNAVKAIYTTQVGRSAFPGSFGWRAVTRDPLIVTGSSPGWAFYTGIAGLNSFWDWGENFADDIIENPWYDLTESYPATPTLPLTTEYLTTTTSWGWYHSDALATPVILTGDNKMTALYMLVAYEGLITSPSTDVLSTVATIDHDLLIGVEEDQHHAKVHDLTGANHTGGYKVKTGASPQITDADFTAETPVNGMVAMTYDTGSGQTLWWVRAGGTWDTVEVTS